MDFLGKKKKFPLKNIEIPNDYSLHGVLVFSLCDKKKLLNSFLSFKDFTELLLLSCNNTIVLSSLQKARAKKLLVSLILLIKIFISYYTW